MGTYEIGTDDPESADVRALLTRHLAFAHDHSPPEDVHALDHGALAADDISFFSVRAGGELLGIGALKQVDPWHAELKSMHVAEAARGRGVGRAMLEHLIDVARTRGCRRVSLETGSMPAFAPARALYESAGLRAGAPFGRYRPSAYSTFMTLDLTRP